MSQPTVPIAPHESKALASTDPQPLVPLRIDVSLHTRHQPTTSTPSLRIVETILLDPWVWPVRRRNVMKKNSNESSTRDHSDPDTGAWIEDNARYLAHNVLTDLEVQGMGRTARHFTNRAEIWSVTLQKLIMDQLRPQLQMVAAMRQGKRPRVAHGGTKLVVLAPSTKRRRTEEGDVEFTAQKDKRDNDDDDDDDMMKVQDVKKTTVDHYESTEKESSGEAVEAESSQSTPDRPTETGTNVTITAPANRSQPKSTTSNTSETSLSHLIPIRIRLSVHGVRIHDDCLWDPSLSSQVTPLDYAQILGRDLNLSQEAIQSIAVDIAEQLYGSPRSTDIPSALVDEGSVVQPGARVTAAWALDSRTHISHVAHLVAQSRAS